MVACTSAGFAVTEASPVGAATAFDALVATLRRLGAGRIVLATPYPDAVTTREVESFADEGITVLAAVSLGRDDDLATVSENDIRALIHQFDPATLAHADAVVLSCTGWPTLPLLAELEASTGRPVLTSNVALAIHSITLTHTREYA